MPKPTRTAKQLQALLIERIEALPGLAGQRTDVHDHGVVWMDPGDDGGPNWTVPVRRNTDTYRLEIARIIRQLQMQYDMEE